MSDGVRDVVVIAGSGGRDPWEYVSYLETHSFSGFVVSQKNGRSAPGLFCAACRCEIIDAKEAGVVWPSFDDHFAAVFVTVLCKTNGCLAQDARWKHWLWQPLDVYLVWLLQNSGLRTQRAFDAAQKHAETLGGL